MGGSDGPVASVYSICHKYMMLWLLKLFDFTGAACSEARPQNELHKYKYLLPVVWEMCFCGSEILESTVFILSFNLGVMLCDRCIMGHKLVWCPLVLRMTHDRSSWFEEFQTKLQPKGLHSQVPRILSFHPVCTLLSPHRAQKPPLLEPELN